VTVKGVCRPLFVLYAGTSSTLASAAACFGFCYCF